MSFAGQVPLRARVPLGPPAALFAAPSPAVPSAMRADRLTVNGDDAVRAHSFAQQFLDHHGIRSGADVQVLRSLPSHAGLGSGTQLALALARALAEIHGIDTDPRALARAMGRGQRSAIGTWTFAHGGLVVEGGRRAARDDCGPLIARLPFPESWRCVVVVPDGPPGMSGADEAEAFARLPKPSEHDVEHVSHLVLMVLLPALADADLESFGRSLSEIQEVTGRWFAPAQGGTFASRPVRALVKQLAKWGAAGVGQSSWGPTVFAVVANPEEGEAMARRVRDCFGLGVGEVYCTSASLRGATWEVPA